uniref:Uncharacterized protein n=1 Tax=Meloidogyne incognita TaxID=6306 RepID=A0A914LGF6_MELIC
MAKNLAIKDPWVQLLVQKLMQFPACLSNELTANLFIQQFFIPNLKRIPSAKFNLLRLTCHHRSTIPLKIFVNSLEELLNIFNKCQEYLKELEEEKELEEGEVDNEEEEEEEGINDKILCQAFIKEFGKLKELMEEAKISRGGGPPPLPQQLSTSSSTPSITSCSSKESYTSNLEEKQ